MTACSRSLFGVFFSPKTCQSGNCLLLVLLVDEHCCPWLLWFGRLKRKSQPRTHSCSALSQPLSNVNKVNEAPDWFWSCLKLREDRALFSYWHGNFDMIQQVHVFPVRSSSNPNPPKYICSGRASWAAVVAVVSSPKQSVGWLWCAFWLICCRNTFSHRAALSSSNSLYPFLVFSCLSLFQGLRHECGSTAATFPRESIVQKER